MGAYISSLTSPLSPQKRFALQATQIQQLTFFANHLRYCHSNHFRILHLTKIWTNNGWKMIYLHSPLVTLAWIWTGPAAYEAYGIPMPNVLLVFWLLNGSQILTRDNYGNLESKQDCMKKSLVQSILIVQCFKNGVKIYESSNNHYYMSNVIAHCLKK